MRDLISRVNPSLAAALVGGLGTAALLLFVFDDESKPDKARRCGLFAPRYSLVIEDGKISCASANRVASLFVRSGEDPPGWSCRFRSGPLRRGPAARCRRLDKRLLIKYRGPPRDASAASASYA